MLGARRPGGLAVCQKYLVMRRSGAGRVEIPPIVSVARALKEDSFGSDYRAARPAALRGAFRAGAAIALRRTTEPAPWKETPMRTTSLFLIAGLMALPAIAAEGSHDRHEKTATTNKAEVRRLNEAEEALKAAATAPDKGIPKHLLEKAECIGVFPGVTKAAFLVGGEFGHGVFTCREKDGSMGSPAFFTLGGGSLGWQFGGESTDLILLVMNEDGMKHLLADKFTLGAEATVAAGPVGRTTKAATDAQMHAEILSWSRSRGLIVGASLSGTVIKPDAKATDDLYGKTMRASDVLSKPDIPVPSAARQFVKTTDTYARHS